MNVEHFTGADDVLVRAEREAELLLGALREIRDREHRENVVDPSWSQRRAKTVLAEAALMPSPTPYDRMGSPARRPGSVTINVTLFGFLTWSAAIIGVLAIAAAVFA